MIGQFKVSRGMLFDANSDTHDSEPFMRTGIMQHSTMRIGGLASHGKHLTDQARRKQCVFSGSSQ